MNKRFLLCVLVSICFCADMRLPAADTLHILEKGETLYSLSRKYSVPLTAILERNRIANAEKIAAGQKIYIPQIYTVQSGDTLYSIARIFSVNAGKLAAANNISVSSILKIGKKLIIPDVSETAVEAIRSSALPAQNTTVDERNTPKEYIQETLDHKLFWPVPVHKMSYLSGKLYGVTIDSQSEAPVRAIASGRVLSRGPHRGYGQVVFIQSETKYVYVYGGLDRILPQKGDHITAGQKLGQLAVDPFTGNPRLYFMVYKNNKPVDPAKVPRDF